MRILVSIICLLCGNIYLNAQSFHIAGVVKDADSANKIENVTVQLLNEDSLFVEGTVTDKSGKFELNKGKEGNMFLVFSFVGYEQNVIRLDNIHKNINLSDILLEEAKEKLNEIVVSADQIIHKVNRQIIFPSSLQMASSSSAFELLSKMMLPDLQVNTTQNTIESLNNGSVQLRVNNVKSTIQDILAILSTQVVKVEYIDMPGARYGDGVASVVNFITKRASNGFSGGVTLKNAVATGLGNDNFYLKYNHKSSEFMLNYDLVYRNLDDRHTDVEQTLFADDGSSRQLKKEGIKSPFKLQQHNLALTYNLVKDKSIFNAKLENRWQNTPYYQIIQSITETGKPNLKANTGIKDKTVLPVLDVYYQLNLPTNQTIMANVVGTYISSDYKRDYAEYSDHGGQADETYNYVVDGEKYSIISELIYEKTFKNILWSSGINYKQFFTENAYNGSTGEVTNNMNNSDLYVYTELDGEWHHFGYNAGIGLSKQYFKEGDHSYNFYTVSPKISFSYSGVKNLHLQYTFKINPVLPTLVQLSNISQWQNTYEVYVGNPALTPFRGYVNSLSARYRFSRFLIQAYGYYQYSPNPILETSSIQAFDNGDNFYQYSYDNQKSYTHLQGRLNLSMMVIPKALSISVFGGINRHINKGNEYTHTNTGFYGGAQLEGMYKNWMLSASVRSKSDAVFGEKHLYKNGRSDIQLSYRLKSAKLGLGIMNPFFKNGEINREKLLYKNSPKDSRTYLTDLGNMIYLSFSWNFSIGKKHKAGEVQLFNSDHDSGIVK